MKPLCMQPHSTKPPLTDSPWFWLLLFSTAALGALAAIGPKYVQRQAAVERRFEARQEIARRKAAGASIVQEPEAPPPEHELLVPLRPLIALAGLVWVAALIMLIRSRRRFDSDAERTFE